jgi:hypothetical protein
MRMDTFRNPWIPGGNTLTPQYRDRAVRMELDDNSWEAPLFDNTPCRGCAREVMPALQDISPQPLPAAA